MPPAAFTQRGHADMSEIKKVQNLVRNSGLGAIAKQCRRLAYARGKYLPDWDPIMGALDVMNEVMGWLDEAARADRGRGNWEPEKLGDLLYVVLSLVDYRGIDVEWVLCETIQRNAERIDTEGLSSMGTRHPTHRGTRRLEPPWPYR